MTVKELIDKLQQFDEDKLVLVEDIDYKNTDKDFYDIKYNKMEYHKSIIGVIISIIASITIISILYFLQN